ncbi:hypothetical protein [Saccharopolyspora sp. NPDC002376]
MRKFVIGAVLSLSALAATAAPAAAAGWQYTGYWFHTKAQCEKKWSDMHGGPQNPTPPHKCKKAGDVYQLWAYSL